MKKSFLFISLPFLLFSCDKSSDSTIDNVVEVNDFLRHPNGLVISEFIEEGVNKTPQYSPYRFFFKDYNSLTAILSADSLNGTYLVFRDDSRTELRITFPNHGLFFELSDDWYFVSQTNHEIHFKDHGDVLRFQKE